MTQRRKLNYRDQVALERMRVAGMSQTQMARGLGISREVLRRYLKGPVRSDTAHKFEATPEMRERVLSYAMAGLTRQQMGILLGIPSEEIIAREFADELARGAPMADAAVVASLYKNATQNQNVVAQIFWLKNRLGWRDHRQVSGKLEHTGEVKTTPAPPPPAETDVLRMLTREMRKLSAEERGVLEQALAVIESASATQH